MGIFDLIVVGGGAAGFYGAIQTAELKQGAKVLILEKSHKVLAKVKISGGGRCNVTHHCFDPVSLARHYPRGEKPLRSVFKQYDAAKTVAWFSDKAVMLKVEADGRMFPVTDNSQTIIDCFLEQTRRLNIRVVTGEAATAIAKVGARFEVRTQSGECYSAECVLVATGGSPHRHAYSVVEVLGHHLRPPIPSLFTFNDRNKHFAELMGISVPGAEIRITGTRFRQQGPLLITHWGLSGPAVIKLSAWAAEYLHSVNYVFTVLVSWIGPGSEEMLRDLLLSQKITRPQQKTRSNPLFNLPQRLWAKLCNMAEIPEERIWGDLSNRHVNRLLENLLRCSFHIQGKTTFKEEFVTCGGIELTDVDIETMESKKIKGVFFAGEVLNVDGETGGFNFQSAWSTAAVAARCIASRGGQQLASGA